MFEKKWIRTFGYIKDQFNKVVQVLYCNLQASILNWQIKMYLFFYCLGYKKKYIILA